MKQDYWVLKGEKLVPPTTGAVWHQNLWWPVEENVPELAKYMLRRVTDVDIAIQHVKTRGFCVQAGGFVGLWPLRLAKTFERVYTFEPSPRLYEFLTANTSGRYEVVPANAALASVVGEGSFTPRAGGRSALGTVPELPNLPAISVPTVTIDSLNLLRCDAIFLDLEGGEVDALNGALDTIRKFSPVLQLEYHKKNSKQIDEWAKANGYVAKEKVHADLVFVKP